jgi:Arc/MetJ family transcription regulator
MSTRVNIDERLLHKAAKLTGVHEKSHLVRLGLEVLIARESSKKLAKLSGTYRDVKSIPRRRVSRMQWASRQQFSVGKSYLKQPVGSFCGPSLAI